MIMILTNDKFPPILWLSPDVRLTFPSLPSSPTNTTVESEYNKGLIFISKRQAELTGWMASDFAEYSQLKRKFSCYLMPTEQDDCWVWSLPPWSGCKSFSFLGPWKPILTLSSPIIILATALRMGPINLGTFQLFLDIYILYWPWRTWWGRDDFDGEENHGDHPEDDQHGDEDALPVPGLGGHRDELLEIVGISQESGRLMGFQRTNNNSIISLVSP